MAYTRSMRLRWGRKAPRSSRPRRSRYPRRRVGRRSYATNSQRGNTSMQGYRGRKMPYKRYLRNMYNSTQFKEHHRSLDTTAVGASSNVSNTAANVYVNSMIKDDFWLPAGGSINPIVPDKDIFIRGGVCSITYRNNGDSPLTIKTWKIFRHTTAVFNISSPRNAMWDPTCVDDFERFWNIRGSFQCIIEPGDQNTITHYIGKRKVEDADFNAGYRRDYWITTINGTVGAAQSVTILVGHNLSFVADRVV